MDVKTPFKELNPLDNLRLASTAKRTLLLAAQLLPTKRLRFVRRPPPFLLGPGVARSKSLLADLGRPKALDLALAPHGTLPPLSPTKVPKLRRLTSLLTPQDSGLADRFIPAHKNSTPGKLTAASEPLHPNALPQAHIHAQTSKIYQHHVAEACGLDVNSRILSYRPLPPERSKPFSLFGLGSFAPLGPLRSLRPLLALERAKKIPAAPDRVLDAPSIVDDFYLNLVAWLQTNLIVIGLEDAVYVWNALTGSVGLLCETPGRLVSSLRWSEDGLYISIGRDDGAVEIWDIETNARLRTLTTGTASRIAAHAWLLHVLTLGSKEGTVVHSDVRVSDHMVGTRRHAHLAEVCGVEYRSDGQQFATGGNDNVVAIWDARQMNGEAVFRKTNHRAAVKAMAWCPYQSLLLATGGGTSDKCIHFWNTATGARVNLIETESQISLLNWGYAKGTGYEVVATHGYPSNNISLFNYPTLQKTGEISQAHDLRILSGCMSPDGTTLATVLGDENLKFWSLFDSFKPDAEPKQMGKLMNLR